MIFNQYEMSRTETKVLYYQHWVSMCPDKSFNQTLENYSYQTNKSKAYIIYMLIV